MNGYKLKLQTPETMKLFSNTKKIIDKTKNGENVPSFEVVEVVFSPLKFSRQSISTTLKCYLLNVESNNLVFLKTYDTDIDEKLS